MHESRIHRPMFSWHGVSWPRVFCRRAWLLIALPLVVVSSSAVSAADQNATFPRLVTVTGDRVNARTGPSTNHFPFARFDRGTGLVAIGLEGDWYRVRLPAAERCWIAGKFLQDLGEDRARVIGNRVAVRVSPGTKHTPIGQVTRGTSVLLSGRKDKTGEWVEFHAPMEATACIHKDYVKLGRPLTAEQEAQIVQSSFRKDDTSSGEPVPASVKKAPIGIASDRILDLGDMYAEIRRRPIPEWDFTTVRTELVAIQATSEDVVEAEFAGKLLDVLDRDIRFKRQYEEGERKKQDAQENNERYDEHGEEAQRQALGHHRDDLEHGSALPLRDHLIYAVGPRRTTSVPRPCRRRDPSSPPYRRVEPS